MDSLAIVSMFKDEAATIKEWIIHHKLEGVQEFILLNNGSTDNSPEIAKQLGCQVIDCPEKHAQEKYLNHFASQKVGFVKSDWIMLIDIDEFVYARKQYEKITDYLSELDSSIDGVRLTFKMFGSSSSITQPASIVDEYVFRGKDNQNLPPPQHWNYKTIFRNKINADMPRICYVHAPEPLGSHIYPIDIDQGSDRHIVSHGRQYCEKCLDIKESEKYLALNHYSIQSKENYYFVRSRKGDVNIKAWEENNIRNYEFFKNRDHRDVSDTELRVKRGKSWAKNFSKPQPFFGDYIEPRKDKLNVFCYWDTGIDNMPKMLQNILFHNKMVCDKNGIVFHLITDQNVNKYIDVEDIFFKLYGNHKSDYARWNLLKRFGGAWIDTDIILLKDLRVLYKKMLQTESELGLNLEFLVKEEELSSQADEKEILKSEDFPFLNCKEKYFKLGCCFLMSRPSSPCIEFAVERMNKILSKIDLNDPRIKNSLIPNDILNWSDIGPILCTDMYKKYHNAISIFGGLQEDPNGFHALTWKVDPAQGLIQNNFPGFNKRQWVGFESSMQQKSQKIMANDNCYYLPSWSIYRENDIDGDVSDFVFNNKHSLFYHLMS